MDAHKLERMNLHVVQKMVHSLEPVRARGADPQRVSAASVAGGPATGGGGCRAAKPDPVHRGWSFHVSQGSLSRSGSVDGSTHRRGNRLIWIGGAPLSLQRMPITLKKIQTGDWDVVVLQEDLVENWSRVDEFSAFARKFHEEIQRSGAETVLYMHWSWASQAVPSTEHIAETYGDLGKELNVKVGPVGLAWQRVLQERPDLDLYTRDQVHASPQGTYLAMCVLYATIFDRSPVGATDRMADTGRFDYMWTNPKGWQLSDENAEFLQRIAWETVADYAETTGDVNASVAAVQTGSANVSASASTSEVLLDEATVAQIAGIVEQAMVDDPIPGFELCIVQDGQVVYSEGFGLANLEEAGPSPRSRC